MAKSRVRRQYEYMTIGVPAAGLAGFLLATGWHIYDPADMPLRAALAAPFVTGGAAAGLFFLNEFSRISGAGRRVKEFARDVRQPRFGNLHPATNAEFVFRHPRLPVSIPRSRLLRFCRIGCRRQEVFYSSHRTLLPTSAGFKRLHWNEVWSEAVFTTQRPRFLPADVKACKIILLTTGQFIRYSQGRAGEALSVYPLLLVDRAERRWRAMVRNL